MMYPFMTLDDDTEIVHSEMLPDGRVKVYIEKPDAKDCFHSAVSGFSPAEIDRYQKFLETTAHQQFRHPAPHFAEHYGDHRSPK